MKIVLQSNRLCVDHIIAVFSSMSWHLIIFIIFQTRIIRSTICSSPQLYEECLRHERKWKIAVENLLSIFFQPFPSTDEEAQQVCVKIWKWNSRKLTVEETEAFVWRKNCDELSRVERVKRRGIWNLLNVFSRVEQRRPTQSQHLFFIYINLCLPEHSVRFTLA